MIGKTVGIKGQLISEEDVVIEGPFDGDLYFKNNSLGVGVILSPEIFL